MPYEKQKAESFQGFGGINTKVSDYITGLHECLDLKNFDFSRPGAWSTRWGSTQFCSITLSGRILGAYEYEQLSGASEIVFMNSQKTILSQGTSGYPLFFGKNGANYSATFMAPVGISEFIFVGGTPSNTNFDNNLFDFKTFVDTLFFCNGTNSVTMSMLMFKPNQQYFGSTCASASSTLTYQFSHLYSLPPGSSAIGSTIGITTGTGFVGLTGLFNIGVGFLDVYGFRSAPVLIQSGYDAFGTPSFVGYSLTGLSTYVGITISFSTSLIPWDYGFTAVSLYLTNPNGSQLFLRNDIPLIASRKYIEVNGYPVGSTFSPTLDISFFPPRNSALEFIPGSVPAEYPVFMTLSPRFLEIYNNQIFMGGFTSYQNAQEFGLTTTVNYQSRLIWTEVGEPEFVDPTFFSDVRTNDGDRISGLKPYADNLMIFKQRSFHSLFGNSSTDISIKQISDQYGCLSSKAAVVYNQQCLFLDRKGIIRWDGANISVASDKIEPVFSRMNLSAAIDNAVGVHFKRRNEVWFGIPVDGSTLNNLTLVYDYISDAWTTFNGFVPSVFATAKGNLSDYTTIYGSYSGAIFNFGASLASDNGTAITATATSLFYRDMGNTVEKQWRRLFVDANIMSSGSTLQIDMIPDHGTSIYATRYIAMGTFQNRIDFGIPAKSLQFKFTYASATLPININGITPESRYQRSV